MKKSLRSAMRLTGLAALMSFGLFACITANPGGGPSGGVGPNQSVTFPSDDLAYTNCATFAEQAYGGAFPFLTCDDGSRAVFMFSKAAFERAEGRDMVTSIVDFRDAECSAISKSKIVQQRHVEIRDGIMVKTTFAGENGWIRYRAPRSVNMVAFEYRPEFRQLWDGARYRLLVITIQDAVGKTNAKIEIGMDSWGVGYADVWGREAVREDSGDAMGEIRHLHRFDLPMLTAGNHIFLFGQRSVSGSQGAAETFYALDGHIIFTSRSFFVPDMFSGFTATIEMPGDAEVVSLLGVLSGEPACYKK